MDFSVWQYPKEVLEGYKKGLLVNGIIDLNISKKEILNYTVATLQHTISKKTATNFNWFVFLYWILISQLVFLFPFISIAVFLFIYI